MPAIVQVYSNDFSGVKQVGASKVTPDITINDLGFTIRLTDNRLGETYVYITQ